MMEHVGTHLYEVIANITTAATSTTAATTIHTPADLPQYVGYIGCFLAAVFFGSNFIPVKKFETGDGLFFQMILCIAIWVPSVILHAIRGFPRFWPLAMLGGFLWCTGNIMVVPIIQTIGMAMGLLIWGTSNMLMGWATGRFGAFGMTPEIPDKPAMNYIGVALCVLSAIVVSLIKPSVNQPIESSRRESDYDPNTMNERDPLIPPFSGDAQSVNSVSSEAGVMVKTYNSLGSSRPSTSSESGSEIINNKDEDQSSLVHKLSPSQRKIAGIVMSLVSGLFYGSNFAPVIYIKDNYAKFYGNCTADPCTTNVSSKDIDYIFSHFTGILLTSTLYFTIYCIVKKNRPKVYPRVILPAMISGVLWSVADIGFFVANEVLDESVSFPIISAGPGIVASLWGVFLFKEIQGRRNLLILALAFCFTTAGCVLCGMSK